MPYKYNGILLGGQSQNICFIDLTYNFNMNRFETLFDAYLETKMNNLTDFLGTKEYENLQRDIFSRINMITCQSPPEFVHILRRIGGIETVSNNIECNSSKSCIDITNTSIIMIDGLTSFWYEHMIMNYNRMKLFYAYLANLLRNIMKQLDISCIVTKSLLFKKQIEKLNNEFKHSTLFGNEWLKQINIQILLKEAILPYNNKNHNNYDNENIIHGGIRFLKAIEKKYIHNNTKKDKENQSYDYNYKHKKIIIISNTDFKMKITQKGIIQVN